MLELTSSRLVIGVALALFGASGVFGQLQDALNTIWGIKPKPGSGIWGVFAFPLSLFRDGRRNLFSIAGLVDVGKRAQSF
jgi:hypothetical protein